MSADIVQMIPCPKRNDDVQTDFPTITFRSARQAPAGDSVDAAPDKPTAANREA